SCHPLPKRRSIGLANRGLSTAVERLTRCRRSPPDTRVVPPAAVPQLPRLNLRRPGVIPPEPGCETTPSLMQWGHVQLPALVGRLPQLRSTEITTAWS